jgi:hypothetical protein
MLIDLSYQTAARMSQRVGFIETGNNYSAIAQDEMHISDLIEVLTAIKNRNGDLKLKMEVDDDLFSIDHIDVITARKYHGNSDTPEICERADLPVDESMSYQYDYETVVVIN